ncbi:hypothetical protein [Nocardioides aequoreus]|uniref:hypothetical protein n=1 Tax=Nocardioides aequoreus TaxID=397278 RepID=UPI0004C3EE67|nr:hypothetical protein [Nocardioides aequoreus]
MSLSPPAASEFAEELARAVVDGATAEWTALAARLENLSGREWLVLDAAARSYRVHYSTPVSGVRGWLGPTLGEPSGLVATVTSLHVDGRIRERATRTLAELAGPVAVTAAAVRLLDHVEQVRAIARQSLTALLVTEPRPDHVVRVLDVVLAGRGRLQGPGALDVVEELARRLFSETDYVDLLMAATPRNVRRHGFKTANRLGMLPGPRLLEAAQDEEDQLIVAWCADWLYERGTPEDFADLLDARSALLRQVAVLRVDGAALPDSTLLHMAADRAPRVREAARHRARKRGLDIASWYRRELRSDVPANRTAAVLDGLLVSGDASDLPSFRAALADPRPRIRAVALRGVAAWTADAETILQVAPLLTDPSSRVSASATRVLARAGAPTAVAADAWASPLTGSRRAAWYLTRSTGGWNAVESDLRLATDPDAKLAGLGRTQISNWLTTRAATTWQPLPESQRSRIAALLEEWDASKDVKRALAFHAGIRPLPVEYVHRDLPAEVVPIKRKRKWWRG